MTFCLNSNTATFAAVLYDYHGRFSKALFYSAALSGGNLIRKDFVQIFCIEIQFFHGLRLRISVKLARE